MSVFLDDDTFTHAGKIKAVLAHPGLSTTQLQVNAADKGSIPGWFRPVQSWFAMSPIDGSLGFLKGLIDPNIESGEFWGPTGWGMFGEMSGAPAKITPAKLICDPEAIEMAWKESEKTTESKFAI